MTTYRYAVTLDADSPEDAAERIEEMLANEGVPVDFIEIEKAVPVGRGTYRKTATVEAVQWTGDNLDEIAAFLQGSDDLVGVSPDNDPGALIVATLEGDLHYPPGYWIVRNPAGEHYGCADDVWQTTYTVHDPAAAADAIMVELSGLVEGVDDGEDVDDVLSTVARSIVAKVLA